MLRYSRCVLTGRPPACVRRAFGQRRIRQGPFRAPDYQEAVLKFIEPLFAPEMPAAVREEVRRSILATPLYVLANSQEGLAEGAMFSPVVLDLPAFALFSAFWKPERFMDVFREYLPRLEYEFLPGVGHYPMLEKPAETNAALARFLTRIQGELR